MEGGAISVFIVALKAKGKAMGAKKKM